MVYTVTFNPSLDYIVSVNDFQMGMTNRTCAEQMLPGGKGINVSTVLYNLGIETKALGFSAGFTGKEIERRMAEIGFTHDFISLPEGCSRINVKLKDFDGTEINGQGPVIEHAHLEALMKKLDQLKAGDILVLAGSIPSSMPASTYEDYLVLAGSIPGSMPKMIYRDIMARLASKGVQFVVDATGELLMNVLEYHPFLIKPNNYELGEIFGVTLSTKEEVILYAKKLQEMGAANVLVSMAGDGAVLVAEDGSTYKSEAPEGKVKNSVGAGDSMVAGFLYGYLKSGIYEDAFYYGVCTGSASAFSENLATREEVDTLLRNIKNRA